MSKSISALFLAALALLLALIACALLAAAVQLGFDLTGSAPGKTVQTGGETLEIGDAELQVSFAIALTLGLLLAAPSYLFGRRALRLIRMR